MKGPLRNFFLSQLLKKQGKDWPFGEWEHGDTGFIAAIADLIGCPSKRGSVENVLRWRICAQDIINHENAHCPCESGKALMDCCSINLEHFWAQISAETAGVWLTRLQKIRSSRTPLEIQREIHKNRPFRRVQ